MQSLVANPFQQERTKVEIPRRRGGQTSQPSPEDISRSELDKHLRALAEGKSADAAIESKFNEYMNGSNSYGYLDDTAVRTLFAKHLKKQITDGNADLTKLVGSDSIFADYIERRRYKSDSIESQLFDYILLAIKQKKDGKDPLTQPVSLAAEGLDGFITHLTDKDNGLSFKSGKLDQLRTSSDPMVRLLRDAAVKLGLQKAIEVTKEQLSSGQSTTMTEKLSESIPDLLKREENKLNEILPPGGSLVVARRSDGTQTTISKIDISSVETHLGADAVEFATGKTLDFGEFFRTAHKLALGGDDDKVALAKHVSDGLSLILAYYKAKVKEAGADQDAVKLANDEFKLISKTIQGKGLLPTSLAKIVREAATTAIMSDDFRNRAAAGDISNLSEKLQAEFVVDLKGGNRDIASLDKMKGFIGNDDKVAIIDPESFATKYHTVSWVESSEIKTPEESSNNRFLTDDSPLSVERIVQAYRRAVDKSCDKVYTTLAEKITGKEGVVQKKVLEQLAQATETAISAEFTAVADVTKLIEDQLIAYKDGKAANTDSTSMENALQKFVEETLNITDGKAKAELWKATTDSEGKTIYTPLKTAVAGLRDAIITSNNTGSGAAATNDEIKSAVGSLVTALQEKQVGADGGAKEKSLFAKLKESKGKDRLRNLLSSLKVKADETEEFSKTLDLDKIVQIFDSSQEGKKLQRAVEDLSQPGSKFSDIKDKQDSEQFGELVTLLFAKDDKGGIDDSKRLTALAAVIKKAAGSDEALLASLNSHIVAKLKGNAVKSTDEVALAIRLKGAVGTNVNNTELGKWINDTVLTSQQRRLILEGTFQNMQRQLDNLRGHFSAVAMRSFGDKEVYNGNLKQAADDIINAAQSLDKDSPNAFQSMRDSLKNNESSKTMFEQLIDGMQVNLLKTPEVPNEHPGDIIDRVVNFLQSAIYSPVLSLWKGITSGSSSRDSGVDANQFAKAA